MAFISQGPSSPIRHAQGPELVEGLAAQTSHRSVRPTQQAATKVAPYRVRSVGPELARGPAELTLAIRAKLAPRRASAPLLVSDMACAACHRACRTLSDDGDAAILAATIMPDHVHLLLRLGARLTLDRAIAKWKAQVSRLFPNFAWQANYFEHRLRPEEPVERYAWYVFMNPYRARSISIDDCWPGWWPASQSAWTFIDRARSGPRPQPESLDQVEETARTLVTGEA